jgi:hypothetical protein
MAARYAATQTAGDPLIEITKRGTVAAPGDQYHSAWVQPTLSWQTRSYGYESSRCIASRADDGLVHVSRRGRTYGGGRRLVLHAWSRAASAAVMRTVIKPGLHLYEQD